MQELRSSRTAAYVAFLRALGDQGWTSAWAFHDESASALLPPRWAAALAWVSPRIALLPAWVRERIIAHVDLLVTRALAIDLELTATLGAGCEQVVILGAGFDSRAHRISALEAACVFEVDHPATQAEKQGRAAHLARTCRDLEYVGCNFECDSLTERLQSAGHRADVPTLWICEGVTLYLDDDALRAMLATIAVRSASKSKLIVEYHDSLARDAHTVYSFVRKILLALWSEPQIGRRSRFAFRAGLERAGFRIDRDFGLSGWGVANAGVTSRPRTSSARLVIASVTLDRRNSLDHEDMPSPEA